MDNHIFPCLRAAQPPSGHFSLSLSLVLSYHQKTPHPSDITWNKLLLLAPSVPFIFLSDEGLVTPVMQVALVRRRCCCRWWGVSQSLSAAWCPLVLYDQRCASALPVHVSAWLFIFLSLCLPNQSLWGNTGSGLDDKLKQLSVVITRRMKKDVNEVEQPKKKRAPAWKRDKMPELL